MSLNELPSKAKVDAVLTQVQKLLGDAESELLGMTIDDEYDSPAYYIEKAFVTLNVLAEAVGLTGVQKELQQIETEARKKGFSLSKMGMDDPYLIWGSRLTKYVDAIAQLYGLKESRQTLLRELADIVQRTEYYLNDFSIFGSAPANEADVHNRIEALLKCYFPDLKRKPGINKPVKTYLADTGIPSQKTLIEYKFISNKSEAAKVADEILADTRGYASKQWPNILFVIYETKRVRTEKEWNELLVQCDLDPENYSLVVLRGGA
jgi:hypothetical protein